MLRSLRAQKIEISGRPRSGLLLISICFVSLN